MYLLYGTYGGGGTHFTLKTTYFRFTYFPPNKLIMRDFVFVSARGMSRFYALENNLIGFQFGSAINKLSLQGQGTVRRWCVLLPYCFANTAHSVQAVSVPVIANDRCSWFSNQGSHFTSPYNQNDIFVGNARTSPFRSTIKVSKLCLKHFNTPGYVYWIVHHCDSWRIKDQLDVTCYFISLLVCSTCFGH
jgi:hypothetical protein